MHLTKKYGLKRKQKSCLLTSVWRLSKFLTIHIEGMCSKMLHYHQFITVPVTRQKGLRYEFKKSKINCEIVLGGNSISKIANMAK